KDDRVLIALGGNALTKKYSADSYHEQRERVRTTVIGLVDLIEQGVEPVITHGNGPQVGNMLLQQELASDEVPALPLDACGSMSQGFIGYLLQQQIRNGLKRDGIDRQVTTVVTEVLVDPEDEEFENPTKPVGPNYSADEAEALQDQRGWEMVETHYDTYRRVVPSPDPLEIIQFETVEELVEQNNIVISTGGGGVPVIEEAGNEHEGVEAVVDKDLSAAKLGSLVEADVLLVLTSVDHAILNYQTSNEIPLERISVSEAREHYSNDEFPPGSMGPKVKGAINFIESGGERAVITHVNSAQEGYNRETGTQIVPDDEL
ncbi:MAG: carbamate kinase, partial [bacterium]